MQSLKNIKKTLILLISFTFIVALGACGSRGNSFKKVDYCETSDKPLPLFPKNIVSKIDITDDATIELEPGVYKYQNIQIYYNNPNIDTRMHFGEKYNSKGKSQKPVYCVGGKGVTMKMAPFTTEIPFINEIKVDESGKMLVSSRVAKIDFRRRPVDPWLQINFEQEGESVEGSLKGQYPTVPDNQQIFAKMKKGGTYTFRAQLKTPTTQKDTSELAFETVRIVVTYKKMSPEEAVAVEALRSSFQASAP